MKENINIMEGYWIMSSKMYKQENKILITNMENGSWIINNSILYQNLNS